MLVSRFIATAVLILGIFVWPIWFNAILAVIFFFILQNYFEIMFVALLYDLSYAAPLTRFHDLYSVHLILAAILLVILYVAKQQFVSFKR